MSFKIIIDNKGTNLPRSIQKELMAKFCTDYAPKIIVFTDIIFEGDYNNKSPEIIIDQYNFVPNLLDEEILESELSKNYLDNIETDYCPELLSSAYIETKDMEEKLAGKVFYQMFINEDYANKFIPLRLSTVKKDLDKSKLLENFSSFKKYFAYHLLESHYVTLARL